MADVPHLDIPLRFDGTGHLAVVEQDTVDDIAACVEAVLRTRPGERSELPNFGTSAILFTELPVDRETLVAQIKQWEPRAGLLIEENPDLLNDTLARLRITVAAGG
jgi:phage baseplate assembly protein W